MNTKELVDEIAKKTGLSKKEVKSLVVAFSDSMKESLLNGYKIGLTGVGTFEVAERKSRAGVNPKTLEKITIPARKVVKFKVSKKLKGSLN